MMLLAVDTATPQVGVALWGDDGLLASSRALEGRRHGEILAPAIQAMVAGVGAAMGDLTAIAVDVGPGLFTGLRVGVATAKALASALAVPAVGLTSLEVVAHPHRRQTALVATVIDARRHEVFRALYRPEGGRLVPVAEPAVATPADLAAELAGPGRAGGVLVVGDGGRRYADVLAGPGIEIGGSAEAHPDAAVLAELAAVRVAAGLVTDADGLRPFYLRDADVRIGWARHDDPAPTATGAARG
jgi:tRNA threonylcarbamoyladenosine biosynthesis protein TsaB